MWLHRQKGNVQGALTGINPPELVTSWNDDQGTNDYGYLYDNTTLLINDFGNQGYTNMKIRSYTANTVDEYKLYVFRNGIQIYESVNFLGPSFINLGFPTSGTYVTYIQAQNVISFTKLEYELQFTDLPPNPAITLTDYYPTTSFNTNNEFIFDIAQQIPEIKTIDFLTGIFKMFNLTAYIENGITVVKTLDDFYSTGDIYDITKHVRVEQTSVNVALPYKQITMGYEDTGTLFALKHNQQFNYEWGKQVYQQDPNTDGDIYNIIAPFSHMKFERLLNEETFDQTDIQWGYSATDNFNASTGNYDAYIGKPLLFYPVLTSGFNMSFKKTNSTNIQISSFIVPSNSLSLDPNISKVNINFKAEVNEWTGGQLFTDTLYQKHYSEYISGIFNSKNRLTIIKAVLPLSILTKYKLNDRFQIVDKVFRINKITTNLLNGESDIELLNEL